MKKETPILFSTPMVKAILGGNKTMTRRTRGLEIINQNPNDWQFEWADFSLKLPYRFTQISTVNEKSIKEKTFNQVAIKCPYGNIGDLLWVRETFYLFTEFHDYVGDGLFNLIPEYYSYKADGLLNPNCKGDGWKPSIHMPKVACRIWLEITNIRVERLQSITEEDAKAEGVELILLDHPSYLKTGVTVYKNYYRNILLLNLPTAYHSFQSLWEQIHGSDSWDLNPWLWVIEFKQIEKPTSHE